MLPYHNKLQIYIGAYTHTDGKGIYRCELDLGVEKGSGTFGVEKGSGTFCRNGPKGASHKRSLTPFLHLAAEAIHPSFLAVHPTRPLLFCTNETGDYEGRPSGAVSAYAIEPESGRLALLNRQASLGAAPCYLSIDPSGGCLMVANYNGGSVACFPIRDDGRLDEASSFVEHQGSSVHPTRQTAPHAHCIKPDPAGRFAFVPDLGQDKIVVYSLEKGSLEKGSGYFSTQRPSGCSGKSSLTPFLEVEQTPGAGPRHIVFSEDARYAYVANELSSTISAFRYDAQSGTLEPFAEVSLLPDDFTGESTAAEIALHPSGRFLYASNRGHDSIAVFEIDSEDGTPVARGHQSSLGQCPRHFCITPEGNYLLAANQQSDNITLFTIDADSGNLSPTSVSLTIPSPVYLLPMPAY